jgi:hypothetical protein
MTKFTVILAAAMLAIGFAPAATAVCRDGEIALGSTNGVSHAFDCLPLLSLTTVVDRMNTGSMLTVAITSPTAAIMVVFVEIMALRLSTAIASEC